MIVATLSLLDITVIAEITACAFVASTGLAAIVNVLVAPTAPVHVF
ncbi:TPA: hypothetical protein IUW67_002513 [Enterococcus faecalis]|nr:hypothetical protein [Enterococcus faecalis]EHV2893083.1 hypothetical protein [Enterococcus faecalis]EIX6390652.1 hypothetical protein [Enterococcus faecalis]EJG4574632.1 hypothetical protein [Enterococcus faecalis]MBJ0430896.1 hypothetical protein [Enterococcus faecalis]MCD5150008.1 hypothetical protein [Enterococcus faecalis]